ncbi:MAG: hypothetical protein IPI49_09125 [Myxococcales bacterium]|nr:hypothetical protein [Myxococcales bacterium]
MLDIGWYPSFSEEGQFVVRVVATSDWDTPLYLHSTSDAKELTDCLPRAVAAAVAS